MVMLIEGVYIILYITVIPSGLTHSTAKNILFT